jgi:hypothetical protein
LPIEAAGCGYDSDERLLGVLFYDAARESAGRRYFAFMCTVGFAATDKFYSLPLIENFIVA